MPQSPENGTGRLWLDETAIEDTMTIGELALHRQGAATEDIEIGTVTDTNHQATVAGAEVGVQGGTGRLTIEPRQVVR